MQRSEYAANVALNAPQAPGVRREYRANVRPATIRNEWARVGMVVACFSSVGVMLALAIVR